MSLLKCPQCAVALRLTPELAGRTVKCGGCGVHLKLPDRIPAVAPPPEPEPEPEKEPEFFTIHCPHCEVALEVEPEDLGQEAPCPACQVPFLVQLDEDRSNKTNEAYDEPEPEPEPETPPEPEPAPEPAPLAPLTNPTNSGIDLFISFDNRDREYAQVVAGYLSSEGKRVFLDADESTSREKALAECGAVAVLLGRRSLKARQLTETLQAFSRLGSDPHFQIIPVLLPGNEDPPTNFLDCETWIDLRSDPEDVRSLARLKAAIEGIEPMGVISDPREQICPWRGLRAFREEDSDLFIGREQDIHELFARVVTQKYSVVPVIGRSGSGKSSLVRAGLFPRLRKSWEIISLRPLGDPLFQLMAALSPPSEEVSRPQQVADIKNAVELFRSGKFTISELIEDILSENAGAERVLLFVDQWEDLYNQSIAEADRVLFIESLLEAAVHSRCTLVFAVRADFYDELLRNRELSARVGKAAVNLNPMREEAVRKSISIPAEKTGCAFEAGLYDRICADAAAAGPDLLPRLQHCLRELWLRREENTLTHAGYESVGGISGSIARRADCELKKLVGDPNLLLAARRLFMNLVSHSEGKKATRAVVPFPEGGPEKTVVERFSRSEVGLLCVSENGVEASHEAFLHHWETLRKWLDRETAIIRCRDRISAAKENWENNDRAEEFLLTEGLALAEGQELLKNHNDVIVDDVKDYIQRSVRRRGHEVQRRKRLMTVVISAVSALAIFAIAASVVTVFGFYKNVQAQDALDRARLEAAEGG